MAAALLAVLRACSPLRDDRSASLEVAEDVFGLAEGGTEVVSDFLGQDVRAGEAGGIFEGFVA